MGVEPIPNTTNSRENQHILPSGGVKAAPTLCPPMIADADLRAVVDAWPDLPADVRKMIAGVVKLTPKVAGRRE
jgi:hypothetical protein